MEKHQLFYSTKCRFCQAFLEELRKTPLLKDFVFICVDPSPSRPALPRWLKSVPSMIPHGSSEPLVGPGAVNNWLFERRLGGSAVIMDAQQKTAERNAPLSQPVYSPDIAPRPTIAPPTGRTANAVVNPSQSNDSIEAYHPAEMSSGKLSDMYSFIGSVDGSSDKIFNPIIRNFESLVAVPGIGKMVGVVAAAVSGGAPKRSAKEQAQINALERYMASRDADIPGPPTRK